MHLMCLKLLSKRIILSFHRAPGTLYGAGSQQSVSTTDSFLKCQKSHFDNYSCFDNLVVLKYSHDVHVCEMYTYYLMLK